MKIDSDLNKQIVSLFQDHQSKISSDFAAINKTVEENISEWSRQNGCLLYTSDAADEE